MDDLDKFLDETKKPDISEVHMVMREKVAGQVPVAKGDYARLPKKVQSFVGHWVSDHADL